MRLRIVAVAVALALLSSCARIEPDEKIGQVKAYKFLRYHGITADGVELTGIRYHTLRGIAALKDICKCKELVMTAATGKGFHISEVSHANGHKVDLSASRGDGPKLTKCLHEYLLRGSKKTSIHKGRSYGLRYKDFNYRVVYSDPYSWSEYWDIAVY